MAWEVEFYRTANGRAPVEDYLDELTAPEAARAARGLDLLRMFGTQLGMPHVRPLRGGIYELRLRGQREHRVLYVGVVGAVSPVARLYKEDPADAPGRDHVG